MTTTLSKIRVLDFAHLLPGELCSTILSDMGMQVTRIEPLEPGLGKRLPPVVDGESLYYWSLHRNKKRLAIDLKKPQGVKLIHNLAEHTDVVVENFRPEVMDRLGIGYEQLSKINPRLIFLSISGYGQKTQWSQRPGHDLNFVAESGVLNQHKNPDGSPTLPGILISDYMSALYGALAVSTHLMERETTGKGKHIDISMFECSLSTLSILATGTLYTGMDPVDAGFNYPDEMPNYNVYRCKDDRYLAVASLERPFWEKFCSLIGRVDLQPRTVKPSDKGLKETIAKEIEKKTLAEWTEVFAGSDCCVSPVNTLQEALSHPLTREKKLLVNASHTTLGDIPQMITPVFNRNVDEVVARDHASYDVRTILSELGLTDEEMSPFLGEHEAVAAP
ncbi:MAG: CoA transferase [Candidatus Melainabacteria bacterium]|nr:CoA transferase [Candidatus Melainabacteria bacterium]